ncbi:MAG: RNA polymerase sigma factor [Eubacteriales bacterium]|nr:RNA polymerase sigma factor [Eubacteriales bacterium]
MQTDEELMHAVRLGDTAAFTLLVTRHRSHATLYAKGILGDDGLAEEVVQDCFVKIYLLRQQYRHGFSFKAYLYTLVRRRCIDLLRKRRVPTLPLSAMTEPESEETPEEIYLKGEARLGLLYAIESLSDEERRLLLQYGYEQKSYQEIAKANRLITAQVKIRLHRIRKKLDKRRKQDDEYLS